MGQEGVRYQVVTEPNKVDKWGQLVTTQKPMSHHMRKPHS